MMMNSAGPLAVFFGSGCAMEPEDTTALLRKWREPVARARLFELVYPELRRMAAVRLRSERNGHTLQTADLVNEVFLRLVRQGTVDWQGRTHFLAVAALGMKRILIDHARRRQSLRRNAGVLVQPGKEAGRMDPFDRLVELDLLIEQLAACNSRVAETFDLHYFGGLTFDEIGAILEIDPRTAKRDWQLATAWLADVLTPGGRA